jgi:predicted butyrate kinase (DUF1464 family)
MRQTLMSTGIATRTAIGVGIGLLVSQQLLTKRRRALGAALVAIGVATTIPAAMSALRRSRRSKGTMRSFVNRDKQLIGATRFPRKGDDDNV